MRTKTKSWICFAVGWILWGIFIKQIAPGLSPIDDWIAVWAGTGAVVLISIGGHELVCKSAFAQKGTGRQARFEDLSPSAPARILAHPTQGGLWPPAGTACPTWPTTARENISSDCLTVVPVNDIIH
jgi:hypothetical protein